MPPRSVVAGAAWMVLAMSGIAIIDGIAKYLTATLNGVQVAWAYFLAMLLWLLIYGTLKPGRLGTMASSRRPALQAVRGGCMVVALASLFFSLEFLPLAEATTLTFTSPLFTVALARPILGESVSFGRWAAVLTGLLGVVLVVRPGTALFDWLAVLPLIGALFFAGFSIVTRLLAPIDRSDTTLFHTFFIGTALLSPVMPAVWTTPSAVSCLILAGTGLLGIGTHLSIVRALRLAQASTLAPMSYIRLVWALAIGALVFDQTPTALALAGSCIIVASGLYVLTSGVPGR